MTSTTYSESKIKQGVSVFLWTLKSNISTLIVYLSILAFFTIINWVICAGTKTAFNSNVMLAETFLTAMVIGLIVSIKSFSYLHDKRQTDMTGALPVSRRTLFFSRLISSAVISGVPMLIIYLVINTFFPNNESAFLPDNNLFVTLNVIVYLFSNISLFGLLSICCGKTSDKIVSFIVLNLLTPFAVYFLTILPASLLMGYSVNLNLDFLLFLSPAFAFAGTNPIYWVIFSAVCLLLSFVLIKNRSAESADSGFAYKLPLIAIKVLASFSVGIVSAFMFIVTIENNNDYLAFWSGMIIGSLIAYIIIQIIFAHGFTGFLKGLIPYGAMLICFAVLFSSLHFGWFGFETYVPDVNDIKSVSFTTSNPIYINGVNITAHEVYDKKVIEDTVKAHKKIISIESFKDRKMLERTKVNYLYEKNNESDIKELGTDALNFNVTYTLKNGIKVQRNYSNFTTYGDASTNVPFLQSEEYIVNSSPLFVCDEKYFIVVEVEKLEDDDFATYGGIQSESKTVIKLIRTIKEDYKKYGISSSSSGYLLTFMISNGEKKKDGEVSLYPLASVNVPSNYSKTLKLIKSLP